MATPQHICPWWMAYTFDNPLRKLFHKPERMFSAHVHPGMTVADIGCGMGYFSLGLARLVKSNGKVLAIDMQPKMLIKTGSRAKRAGLAAIIEPRLCDGVSLDVGELVDFALAFWMVHETPDQGAFFEQIRGALKPAGRLFVAEPKQHVSRKQFDDTLRRAQTADLHVVDQPSVALSRAALLKRV